MRSVSQDISSGLCLRSVHGALHHHHERCRSRETQTKECSALTVQCTNLYSFFAVDKQLNPGCLTPIQLEQFSEFLGLKNVGEGNCRHDLRRFPCLVPSCTEALACKFVILMKQVSASCVLLSLPTCTNVQLTFTNLEEPATCCYSLSE